MVWLYESSYSPVLLDISFTTGVTSYYSLDPETVDSLSIPSPSPDSSLIRRSYG